MTYADPTERAELISGFRALADFFESHPDVPAPSYADVYAFPPDATCPEMRAEIDAIAALLGTSARETARGKHYTATRPFGPVEYRAVAVCPHEDHTAKGDPR